MIIAERAKKVATMMSYFLRFLFCFFFHISGCKSWPCEPLRLRFRDRWQVKLPARPLMTSARVKGSSSAVDDATRLRIALLSLLSCTSTCVLFHFEYLRRETYNPAFFFNFTLGILKKERWIKEEKRCSWEPMGSIQFTPAHHGTVCGRLLGSAHICKGTMLVPPSMKGQAIQRE